MLLRRRRKRPSSPPTKFIVGLGNPDPEYTSTRHNVGFRVVDELAARHGAPRLRRRFQARVTQISLGEEQVLLLQPLTYMNRSGLAVAAMLQFYQASPQDLLVVCDDFQLPLGKLRLRRKGSAGGHRGLQSIIAQLGTQEFPRLRLGIGNPGAQDPVEYVLSPFPEEEREIIAPAIVRAAEACEVCMREGLEAAMNQFN